MVSMTILSEFNYFCFIFILMLTACLSEIYEVRGQSQCFQCSIEAYLLYVFEAFFTWIAILTL